MVLKQYALGLLAWLLAQALTIADGQTVSEITPSHLPISRSSAITIILTGVTTQVGDVAEFAASGSCPATPAYDINNWNQISIPTSVLTSAGTFALCYKTSAGTTVEQTGITLVMSVSTPFAFSAISASSIATGVATSITLTTAASANTGDKVEFSTASCSGNLAASGTASGLTNGATSHTISFTLSSTGVHYLCYVKNGNTDSIIQYLDAVGSLGQLTKTLLTLTSASAGTITAISPASIDAVRSSATDITLTGSTSGDLAEFAASGDCNAMTTPSLPVSASNTISLPGGSFSITVDQTGATGPALSSDEGLFFFFSNADGDRVFGTTSWERYYVITQTGSKTKTGSVRMNRANFMCRNEACGYWQTGQAGADFALSDTITFAGPTTSAGTYVLCYKASAGSTVEQGGVALTATSQAVCSVTSGASVSAAYPCTCGTATCTAAQTCTGLLNQCMDACSVVNGASVSAAYPCACGTATCANAQTCTSASNQCLDACSVVNGASFSAAYPCTCGTATCTNAQTCTSASNQCTSASPTPAPTPSGSGASAGSDPVATFGGKQVKFELPLQQLVPLLEAPDLVISGSVFAGGPSEQWFNRMLIATPGQERWIEIHMKSDLEHFNASTQPLRAFQTLDVTIGNHVGLTSKVPGYDMRLPRDFMGYQLLFRKVRRSSSVFFSSFGRMPRECLDVAGSSLHIYICSAPADEYYGELRHLSLRYAHLDLAVIEAHNMNDFKGVLPELWGFRNMSEATRSYVINENVSMTEAGNVSRIPSVGGYGQSSEDLKEGCLEPDDDKSMLAI